jgi:hypothetical protein
MALHQGTIAARARFYLDLFASLWLHQTYAVPLVFVMAAGWIVLPHAAHCLKPRDDLHKRVVSSRAKRGHPKYVDQSDAHGSPRRCEPRDDAEGATLQLRHVKATPPRHCPAVSLPPPRHCEERSNPSACARRHGSPRRCAPRDDAEGATPQLRHVKATPPRHCPRPVVARNETIH